MSVEDEPLPLLDRPHERHPGLTESLAAALAEAAAVCLSRHHESPVSLQVERPEVLGAPTRMTAGRQAEWGAPDGRMNRAWSNRDDATCMGAYAVSIAAVEAEVELFAIGRADVRTGADWFVAPREADPNDYEAAIRLEVAGNDHGSRAEIRRRLQKKKAQASKGEVDGPALAAVVGFKERFVIVAAPDEPRENE